MKVINYKSKNFNREFYDSFKEYGIAIIDNHGIHPNLYEQVKLDWYGFFKSADKYNYICGSEKDEGYIPHSAVENCLESKTATRDFKELAHFYPNRLPPQINDTHNDLYKKTMEIALKACTALDKITPKHVLRSQRYSFYEMINKSKKTCLRINHYIKTRAYSSEFICAPHKDINFMTLLLTNNDATIQSKTKLGEWLDVPRDKRYLIINSGETLEAITQSHFPSNVHQILNPNKKEQLSRLSMELLVHPHRDVHVTGFGSAENYVRHKLGKIGFKFKYLNF